jgi:hypothetical protein
MIDNPFPDGTWEAAAWEAGQYLINTGNLNDDLEYLFDGEYYGSLYNVCYRMTDKSLLDLVPFLAGKQHDYGPENVLKFGETGLRVRMWDKIARINNLEARYAVSVNEPMNDSYVDLMGYCVIMQMLRSHTFTQPLICDTPDVPAPDPVWDVYGYTVHNSDTMFYDDAFTIAQVGVTPEGQPVMSATRVYK